MPRLEASLAAAAAPRDGALLLIGRRQLRSNNSWMHNGQRLVKGRDACVLLLNPGDTAARGLRDGNHVVVSSRVGAVEVARRPA